MPSISRRIVSWTRRAGSRPGWRRSTSAAPPGQWHLGEFVQRDEAGAQPVVEIVVAVGDVVGDGRDLRLQRRLLREREPRGQRVLRHRRRRAAA